MNKLPTYTVVGLHSETDERFADHVDAASPDEAEEMIRATYPEILIAAVFEGELMPVDTGIYGRAEEEWG